MVPENNKIVIEIECERDRTGMTMRINSTLAKPTIILAILNTAMEKVAQEALEDAMRQKAEAN